MKSLHNNKESIQQEDLTYVNIYAYNIGAPTYIKQILTYLPEGRNQQQYNNSRGLKIFHFHQWVDQPDRKSIKTHWT